MIISCNTIVDRRDHVQYLTVSKSYSDNCGSDGNIYVVSGAYRSTCTQTYACAYNLTQIVQGFRYNKTCLRRPPKIRIKIVKK